MQRGALGAPLVRAPAGRPRGPLRPEITAIVSFDVHCYLRFVRGASSLFLYEKFSQALQIFIVLYNEPSWTAPFGAASERKEPNTSILARTNSNSRMETRGAPRRSDPFSWPNAGADGGT
jgi:hypothetical protein